MRGALRSTFGIALIAGAILAAPSRAEEARHSTPATYASLHGARAPARIDFGGRWRVQRIDGVRVPSGLLVTIEFGAPGHVSGRSGCNRFTGPYTLTPTSLSFGNLAATRMACAGRGMEVEARFFKAIGRVDGFARSRRGAVLLKSGKRTVLLLRRG
ncbi:META domain-containing protein [Enterovirga rhinocerotis]|uniref:Heat shock protein HslJ n=1 Tax=Enterovirga rhinocerotis TaxID=1339210 RepID=A0A4R7C7B9_9HYPH|nr:META domain-containing protein [Enterovirga rhinocerotis]TDR94043.1 heat shock protein HslJ [Enterovirga rhinocerotis]